MSEQQSISFQQTFAGDAHIKGALEAMLFACGEAQEISKMSLVLGIPGDTVQAYIEELSAEYAASGGIEIIRIENKYQMRTKPDCFDVVKALMQLPQKRSLSSVLLETLAIVAYKQPVTKASIEEIRGLNADYAVNRLLEMNLIREAGRLDAPGRPILLGTTEEFLRRFGVPSLSELPEVLAEFSAAANETDQTTLFDDENNDSQEE